MPKIDWQEKTEPIFRRHPQVVTAWLFGSAHRGMMRPDSDIDIAVLFDSPPLLDELFDLRTDLQLALPFAEIDLVALRDDSHPILRFEAVSGKLLFCRNISRRVEFVSLAAREYEDAMVMVQRYMKGVTRK